MPRWRMFWAVVLVGLTVASCKGQKSERAGPASKCLDYCSRNIEPSGSPPVRMVHSISFGVRAGIRKRLAAQVHDTTCSQKH